MRLLEKKVLFELVCQTPELSPELSRGLDIKCFFSHKKFDADLKKMVLKMLSDVNLCCFNMS